MFSRRPMSFMFRIERFNLLKGFRLAPWTVIGLRCHHFGLAVQRLKYMF